MTSRHDAKARELVAAVHAQALAAWGILEWRDDGDGELRAVALVAQALRAARAEAFEECEAIVRTHVGQWPDLQDAIAAIRAAKDQK